MMKTVLVDRFLSLIAEPYKAKFALTRFSDPDMKFKDVFQHFLNNYGEITEHNCKESRSKMKALWALQDGWLLLQKQIDDGIMYSLFAQCPIPNNDILDIAMQVILKTGVFALKYGEWHARSEQE